MIEAARFVTRGGRRSESMWRGVKGEVGLWLSEERGQRAAQDVLVQINLYVYVRNSLRFHDVAS